MRKYNKFVALLLAVALVCSMSTVLAVDTEVEDEHCHDGECCAVEVEEVEIIDAEVAASPKACSHSNVYYRNESSTRYGSGNVCYYIDVYTVVYCTDCGKVLSRSLSNSTAYGHSGTTRCTRCGAVI